MIDINVDYSNYYIQSADENSALQGVESVISQIEAVDYCVALIWKNRLLVGVISKPLFGRSERTQLEEQIKQAVDGGYGFDEVLISFDMDIIHEISKLNKNSVDSKLIEQLFYSVKVRRTA